MYEADGQPCARVCGDGERHGSEERYRVLLGICSIGNMCFYTSLNVRLRRKHRPVQ